MPAPGVAPLDAAGVGAAADALAASFAAYPAYTALFPDPGRRPAALHAFFLAVVADALGFGAVSAGGSGGRLDGVAVWLPPGAFPWSAGRVARAAGSLLRVLAADPGRFGAFVRYARAPELAPAGARECWYLVAIGVRPAAQARGLGAALLAPALARADRERAPCRLATADPANLGFYARFGFAPDGPPARLVKEGPAHHMLRRPAPT
jgi:GNAT superfamily N-acetyltransferase